MDIEKEMQAASDSSQLAMSDQEKKAGLAPISPATSLTGPPLPAVPGAPTTPASDIPDGGLEAWLQVFGSWAILIATWGLVNSFGVFQAYYETKLLPDQTSSSISWIGSLQAALLLLIGVSSFRRHLLPQAYVQRPRKS